MVEEIHISALLQAIHISLPRCDVEVLTHNVKTHNVTTIMLTQMYCAHMHTLFLHTLLDMLKHRHAKKGSATR